MLKDNNFWYKTFEHQPVLTSEQASKVRPGYTLHQGAKAMIVRIKITDANKRFIMLVLPADLRFDNAKVKSLFGAKDIRFATEDEVIKLTDGVQIGAVPPFGNLFNLEVIADPELLMNDKIVFNAGERTFSVAMLAKDYKMLGNPNIRNITNGK